MVDGLMRGLFIAGILILAAVTAEAQAPEAGLNTDAFLAACIADPVVTDEPGFAQGGKANWRFDETTAALRAFSNGIRQLKLADGLD